MDRFARLGVRVLPVLAVLLASWLLWPRQGPSFPESAHDRIKIGMSLAEAIEVIGVPPGSYRLDGDFQMKCFAWQTGEVIAQEGRQAGQGWDGLDDEVNIWTILDREHWLEEAYCITLTLESGTVIGKRMIRMQPSDPFWLRWVWSIKIR